MLFQFSGSLDSQDYLHKSFITLATYSELFFKIPTPSLMAFTWVTNAHGPSSPKPTTIRSRTCSLMTTALLLLTSHLRFTEFSKIGISINIIVPKKYRKEFAVRDDADESDAVRVAVEGRGRDAVNLAEAAEEERKTN